MFVSIVYEDDYCVIVNKPSNLLVHHSYYARNIEEDSLVEVLKQQGFETPIPVHRLDRKTSGLLLLAKTKERVSIFQQLFDEQQIQKTYLALLRGHVETTGVIDTPVKNDRGNYKEALTEFRCLEQFERPFAIPPYPSQRYSLVEFIPRTGRMHQLRIHANKMAHPIINDPKYGNRHHNHYFQEVLGVEELFLHAAKLEFTHPILNEDLVLEVPLPDFWNVFLNQ
jgi:tRNA pseudouridine65 synthase